MSADLPLSGLKIQNEAFLIASTIERCPKTMMLREIVMNALEAATLAQGERRAEIKAKTIDGVRKLCVWNSGQGMTAAELHAICNLASSLYKENALDRNFGMGAKVASLPSNKHGLRYRSCCAGMVSEVTMGQRGGLYGRLPYRAAQDPVAAEVDDVTERCKAEGEYDLSHDWTEVALFGNSAMQDTVRDPYCNDPTVPENWIIDYLRQRFFRLPHSVTLSLKLGDTNSNRQIFRPTVELLKECTQLESVQVSGGIILHYGYWAEPNLSVSQAGRCAVVSRMEIYATRQGEDWLLDAPIFGMPFGAAHYTVFVELPDGYPVVPDLYRQFLRFQNGDQRQVFAQDFAGLVRHHIPCWLRDIIASYGPPRTDYLGEISGDLQNLIEELGIPPQPRGAQRPRGIEDTLSPEEQHTRDEARKTPSQAFESSPDIISLTDEVQIDERGLQGRVARYYPATHQIFVNLTYASIIRMAVQLEQVFENVSVGDAKARLAQELAGWAITRHVARAVIYSLSKRAAGWLPEEVNRAQSPEALSIVADDYAVLLPATVSRMARLLDVETPDVALVGFFASASPAARLASDLADAKQMARRVLKTGLANPAPILRRVSALEARRRNWLAAIDWARQAVAADQSDVRSHIHLAQILEQQGEVELAVTALKQALSQNLAHTGPVMRQLSLLKQRLGEPEEALRLARQAVAESSADIWSVNDLAEILTQQGHPEEAAAVVREAMARAPHPSPVLLRRLASLAAMTADMEEALRLSREAFKIDASDAWSAVQLSQLLVQQGQLEEALAVVQATTKSGTAHLGPLMRQLLNIERQRRNLPAAIVAARRSLEVEPQESWVAYVLVDMLIAQGELDQAEQAAHDGLIANPDKPAPFLRQLSAIAARRQDKEAALRLAREALDTNPDDVASHIHLAQQLVQQGALDEADLVLQAALERKLPRPSPLLREVSLLEFRRGNLEAAIATVRGAVAADPEDPWNQLQLSNLLVQQGSLDEAARILQMLVAKPSEYGAIFLRQFSELEAKRQNLDAAVALARQAIAADPCDPNAPRQLAGLLMASAPDAAEEVLLEALHRNSSRPALLLRELSTLAQRRNDLGAALSWARRAVSADPDDLSSYDHLIGLAMQAGDLEEAETTVREALQRTALNGSDIARHLDAIAVRRQQDL